MNRDYLTVRAQMSTLFPPSVYLGLDEESYASIKDSVKELWNLIG